ncbi:hypothetical protein HKX48_007728 [Thoreauomyces humboldtii]|nr:hypothetical protein HKX48_007728 [Thoreauomyces humboldtii]
MSSHGPTLASTNLNPALFQSLYQNLGGSFESHTVTAPPPQSALTRKRAAGQEGGADQDHQAGQRKNHAHLSGLDSLTPSMSSLDSLDSNSMQGTQPQAAAAASGTVNPSAPVKKKPGRKPATTEPANKRTAQNRAAQRAFRERKERYVKELEDRLAQMEDAQTKSEGGELIGENSRLRQKIAELENENKALRSMPFAFDFPEQDVGNASALKLGDLTADGTPYNVDSYQFRATDTSSLNGYGSISPTTVVNAETTPPLHQSSPFSTNSNEIPALLEGDSYALFDDLHSSTLSVVSEHESHSLADQNDLDSILAGIPLGQFSFTDSLQQYAAPTDFSNNFATISFQGYREPSSNANPFSATFTNPFTTDNSLGTDAEFDEFLSLTGAERPTQHQQASSQQYQPQQPPQHASQQILQQQYEQPLPPYTQQACVVGDTQKRNVDAATWQRTKDIVDDPNSIEELCDLFKVKAQCTEMVAIQNQILNACEQGKKDEVMDLLLVAKEKKRMHFLRTKAGVTVLPGNLEECY